MSEKLLTAIVLSNGWRIVPAADGSPEMGWDESGHPLRLDENISVPLAREYREKASAEIHNAQLDQALNAQADRGAWDAASQLIRNSFGPSTVEAANTDPAVFNKLFADAKEFIGPSDAERQAEYDRQDRVEELRGKLAEEATADRHGRSTDFEAVAELLDKTGRGGGQG
jgi:hypothetical protein